MSSTESLRSQHRDLLQELKESQKKIKSLVVSLKNSDPKVIEAPLTSTGLGIDREQSRKVKKKSILKSPDKRQHKTQIIKSNTDLNLTKKSKNNASRRIRCKNFAENQKKTIKSNERSLKLLENVDNIRPYTTKITNPQPTKSILKIPIPSARCSQLKENIIESDDDVGGGDHISKKKVTEDDNKYRVDNRPLLGYDWIAGIMDNESLSNLNPNPIDVRDDVFNEIVEFRKNNRKQCQSNLKWDELMKTPKTPKKIQDSNLLPSATSARSPDPSDIYDSRIVNYTINKRLFPVPVSASHSDHPTTSQEPRYVRVSIPQTALASPYRYDPKKRSAYSASEDSLALPDHCLLGWKNTVKRSRYLKRSKQATIQVTTLFISFFLFT